MKRLALAGSIIAFTFILGILAVAVAQRDARQRSEETTLRPDYSQQQPDPLLAHLSPNDVELASDQGVPPLDVPPPLSSKSVVRGNDESSALGNPLRRVKDPSSSFVAPPSLDSASSFSNAARTTQESAKPTLLPAQSPFANANTSGSPNLRQPPTASISDANVPSMPAPLATATSQPTYTGSDFTPSTATPQSPSLQQGPASIGQPPLGQYSSIGSGASSGFQSPQPTFSQSTLPQPSVQGMPPSPATGSNGVGGGLQDRTPIGMPASLTSTPQTQEPPRRIDSPTTSQEYSTGAMSNNSARQGPTANSSMPSNEPYRPLAGSSRDMASDGPLRSTSGSNLQGLARPSGARSGDGFKHLVNEKPGQRILDGAQNPSLQLQKRAPEEVQVGQPATFSLIVRNVGNATAHDVTVIDKVPSGTRLSRAQPNATPDQAGNLTWSLGEMAAGSEQTIVVELIPETEGEIGSVASVTFASQASVRTVSTQPKLEISQVLDSKVLVGQMLDIRIQISNNGTGVARDIVLVEEVPNGLKHPQGPSMELPAFHLEPGESRTIPLELLAVEPLVAQNIVRATAANAAPVESLSQVHVIAPKLQVQISGPKLRYLERQATYQITISNPGTAIARDVDLRASLPKGLRFNDAGNDGQYVANQHAVIWSLEELGPNETATTELVVLPVEEGDFVIRAQSQARDVKSDAVDKPVRVEGQSELAFSIEDDNDPIETDGFTTYVIKVSNIGTRGDRQVQVAVELPNGAEVLQVNAPTPHKTSANGILFEPIPEMRAKDQQIFRFAVKLGREGTQVVRAFVKSQQRPVAVVKEESTQVYSDK